MGDSVDLEGIFRAHQKEIFVYMLRTLDDRHLAEDLAQETFERACTAALVFRGGSSIRTWLFAIARRTLADHFRKRQPTALGDVGELAVGTDPSTRLAVEEALAALPVISREAVVLCDLLGLSPIEAAEVTGVNSNAFRVRLHRARQQFREVYGHDDR